MAGRISAGVYLAFKCATSPPSVVGMGRRWRQPFSNTAPKQVSETSRRTQHRNRLLQAKGRRPGDCPIQGDVRKRKGKRFKYIPCPAHPNFASIQIVDDIPNYTTCAHDNPRSSNSVENRDICRSLSCHSVPQPPVTSPNMYPPASSINLTEFASARLKQAPLPPRHRAGS